MYKKIFLCCLIMILLTCFIGCRRSASIQIKNEDVGQFIYFGKYPQTVVKDKSIISRLDIIKETNSLGYIEFQGDEYLKLQASPRNDIYTFIDGGGIITGEVYYFKVEPIKWRVLEQDGTEYLLMSEYCLDTKKFYINNKERNIDGKTIYSNNYQYSLVRAWLNGLDARDYGLYDYSNKGFYDIAFSSKDKRKILDTVVDNSFESSGFTTYDKYFCEDTIDKVFLLGYQDVLNIDYGFSGDYLERNVARYGQVTDYARSIGSHICIESKYYGNGSWMLRTPSPAYFDHVVCVVLAGDIVNMITYENSYSIRPAIRIKL